MGAIDKALAVGGALLELARGLRDLVRPSKRVTPKVESVDVPKLDRERLINRARSRRDG